LTAQDPGRAFYAGLIEALTSVTGLAQRYLHGHDPRVALLMIRIGSKLDLNERDCSQLVFGAVLADMDMVGLAEDAWENPVAEPSDEVRNRVRHPHEWWDGGDYPDGLSDLSIILRLADTVTALGRVRPHRSALLHFSRDTPS
jgi:HD-GYP domain-containing protein (c-di-GMP phosphodiesterase class II)